MAVTWQDVRCTTTRRDRGRTAAGDQPARVPARGAGRGRGQRGRASARWPGCDLVRRRRPGRTRRSRPSPLLGFLAATTALADRYDAALLAAPALAAQLTPIRDAHRAHAKALAARDRPADPAPVERRRAVRPATRRRVRPPWSRPRRRRTDEAVDRLPGRRARARPAGRLDRRRPGDPPGGADVTQRTERSRAALSAEHAAIFGYGVVGAHLDPAGKAVAADAEAAHRNRRDALVAAADPGEGGRRRPRPPAYALPFPVTDRASALKLAVALEDGAAAAWRQALGPTTGDDRTMALNALIDCAVRATRWRAAAGITPVTVPFPGAPGVDGRTLIRSTPRRRGCVADTRYAYCVAMSVKHGLLALLERGSRYGYQLRGRVRGGHRRHLAAEHRAGLHDPGPARTRRSGARAAGVRRGAATVRDHRRRPGRADAVVRHPDQPGRPAARRAGDQAGAGADHARRRRARRSCRPSAPRPCGRCRSTPG